MKNNGFIATSLIYSFFLIFVTLFLTIIADYLQNKVLLNTIEKGIKDEINNSMGIKDFEVGDMVNFDDVAGDTTQYSDWVIAKVDTIDQKLVLYSLDTIGNIPDASLCNLISEYSSKTYLNYNDFNNDIEFAYRNATYYNKLIYTFTNKDVENNNVENYKLDINGSTNYVLKKCSLCELCKDASNNVCTKGTEGCSCSACSRGEEDCICNVDAEVSDQEYDSQNNCIVSSVPSVNGTGSSNQRFRIEIKIGNNRLSKIDINIDETVTSSMMLNCK